MWTTDGTNAGTVLFKDINSTTATANSNPAELIVCDNKLFFRASDGRNGEELWVCDGTVSGTVMVKDIYTGLGFASTPLNLYSFNNKLFFSANDGTNGKELWVSDGTASGTLMLKDINTTSNAPSSPKDFTFYLGKLYFIATTSNVSPFDYQLYVTDGSTNPDSTHIVAPDIATNVSPLYPDAYNFGLKVSNGLLYFPAKYTSVGVEPYVLGAIAPNGLENTASNLEIEMYPNPSNNQLLIKSADY